MKIGLLICTYNRPDYLRQCLEYLGRADLSKLSQIVIVDDCSTDTETIHLIGAGSEPIKFHPTVIKHNSINCGIKQSLVAGYEILFGSRDIDLVINLDSDALVRNDFIERIIENYIPNTLLTGFHSTTKNETGGDRHPILQEIEHHYIKKSVGGINFCIDKEAYHNFVKPALETPIGNWDYIASCNAGQVYCLKESVIQHIGFNSSMGHHSNPDVADNFIDLYLPTVTLIGADSEPTRLKTAADICTKNIKFGAVELINIDLRSKEQYSNYVIDEFYKHVSTSHMLICQHDGYVHNWQAWGNDWLKYDYIGAPWHYSDGMAVGNGGFSLRSRRLMEIVATDPYIQFKHPEDHHICRTYRVYLESTYGIKFAPIEVAEKFSFEGYLQPGKTLTNQFGKHGNLHANTQPKRASNRYVFNQFLSLGDILFLIPLYRALVNEGNTCLWPIDAMYLPIAKHFPDVNFVNKADYDLPYDSMQRVDTPHGQMLPYRYACEIMGRTLIKCMESKYNLYHHDHNIWRQLYWIRDRDAEKRLISLLNLPEKFVLVNRTFGHLAQLSIKPELPEGLPVVEMRNIPSYTLIDWMAVVELATEVHVSNSSMNYLIELSALDKPVHLYPRKMWGEIGYEYTMALWSEGKFIYH